MPLLIISRGDGKRRIVCMIVITASSTYTKLTDLRVTKLDSTSFCLIVSREKDVTILKTKTGRKTRRRPTLMLTNILTFYINNKAN